MRPKTYSIFSFIIENINCSVSFVQCERFRFERGEVQAKTRQLDGGKDEDEEEEEDEEEQQRLEEKVNHKKGLFNDILWMLEYNQNGFMQLVICFVHLYLLISQVITSFLYISLPTNQDPITGKFVNPTLRIARYFSIIDFIHKFDVNGRYNLLIGLVSSQFLILRLRAFKMLFKKAKVNRYQYRDMNIIDMEIAYASEFRSSQLTCMKKALGSYFNHECLAANALSGEARKATLEFNKKVRGLNRIDKIYYYNQIDFKDCFENVENVYAFEEYHKKIEEIDRKLLFNKSFETNQVKFDERRLKKERSIGWFKYLLCVNLPNKIHFNAVPEYRTDLVPDGLILYLMFFFGTIISFVFMLLLIITVTLTAIKYQNWDGQSIVGSTFALLKTSTTHLLFVLNSYDCALLAYCSILLSSRSNKIIKLLEKELKLYSLHLKRVSDIYKEYQFEENVRDTCKSLHNITTGFKRRFDGHERMESPIMDTKLRNFSFLRKDLSFEKSSVCHYHHHADDKIDLLDELIFDYKENMSKIQISDFNENISYLLDLVEVTLVELNDHKKYFTTILDAYVIFGILGFSVTLAILFNVTDMISISYVAVGSCACFIPMIFTLLIGAASEASVSSLKVL